MKAILNLIIPFISGAIFFVLSVFLFSEAVPIIIALVAVLLTITNITYSASRNSKNIEQSEYYTNAANTFFRTALAFIPLLFLFYILRLFLKAEINIYTIVEAYQKGIIFPQEMTYLPLFMICWFIIAFIAHYYFKIIFNFVTEVYRLNKYLKERINDYHWDFTFSYLMQKKEKKKSKVNSK